MTMHNPQNDPDSVFKDPFTGTTPTGPIEAECSEEVEPKASRWGTTARWVLLVVLMLIFAGFMVSR